MRTKNEIKHQPLLSICIPTYNGGNRLPDTLKYLSDALTKVMHNVEILIVDNCSDDNTYQVVRPYLKDRRWNYHKNHENIGYNYSVINIIKNLTKGTYTWLLGDDDWVIPTILEQITSRLQLENIDYISLGHKVVNKEDFSKIEDYIEDSNFFDCTFEEAIEKNCCDSNILGTFMSSAIFRSDMVRKMDFSHFNRETWTDFKSVFPIGYLMAHTFCRARCACLNSPGIICILQQKSWDYKLIFMNSCIIPRLYDDFIKTLYLNLPKNEYLVRRGELRTLFKRHIELPSKLLNLFHLSYFISHNPFKDILIKVIFRNNLRTK